jgi:hypothetical protein
MKVWSISTTVRNPERIPEFASAIQPFIGMTWDKQRQVEFMYELIRRRLYKPTKLTDAQAELVNDVEREMTTTEAKDIFEAQNYEDPPMRGRTAISPVRDVGLVRLQPTVQLTDIGKALVDKKITLQDVLLNYGLKWEVPTPGHKTFTAKDGYYIKPFIGTLALISRVNSLWLEKTGDEVGISKEEFNIYGPTLIDYKSIDTYAERIVAGRLKSKSAQGAADKLAALNEATVHHLSNLPNGSSSFTEIDLNNLRDFGDNAIRYFRQTGFIEFRGAGRYVDIGKTAKAQVELLLEQELYKPVGYQDQEEYLDVVGDLNAFTPPWATKEKLKDVKDYLKNLLKQEAGDVKLDSIPAEKLENPIRGEDAEIIVLKEALLESRLSKLKVSSRSRNFVEEFIEEYEALEKKNYEGYLPKPVALEFNTFKAFLSLNDALAVKPNYPQGDDGEPISTAPGGGTDLYCEYESFVLSVEVTMSTGRSQWQMEGQPVQRHLRDVEDSSAKPAYSLFLAPKLHADTVDTFWIANVHGYQGQAQKIIPLEFEAWRTYLRSVSPKIVNGELKHNQMLRFFEAALPIGDETKNSLVWKQRINSPEFLEKVAVA